MIYLPWKELFDSSGNLKEIFWGEVMSLHNLSWINWENLKSLTEVAQSADSALEQGLTIQKVYHLQNGEIWAKQKKCDY